MTPPDHTPYRVAGAGSDLLPCPFCGTPALTGTYETESLFSHAIVTYLQVGCNNCDVTMASEDHDEVRAAWNTRAPSSPEIGERVETLADLKAARQKYADGELGAHALLLSIDRALLALSATSPSADALRPGEALAASLMAIAADDDVRHAVAGDLMDREIPCYPKYLDDVFGTYLDHPAMRQALSRQGPDPDSPLERLITALTTDDSETRY